MTEPFSADSDPGPGRRIRLILTTVILPGAQIMGSMSPALAAREGGYVPPSGIQSLDSLMGSDSGNGYGIEALVTQGGASAPSSGKSGRSIIDSMKTAPSPEAAARKAMRAENRKLKSRVDALTSQLSDLKLKLVKAQEETKKSSEKTDTAAIQAATARAEAAEGKAGALATQVKDLQQQLTAATGSLSSRDKTLSQLQAQLAELQSGGNKADEQLTRLTADLAARDGTLKTQKKQLSVLENQVSTLKASLADQQAKTAAAGKQAADKLAATQKQLAEQSTALVSAQSQLKQAQEATRRSTAEQNDLKAKLTAAATAQSQAETSLASVREQLKAATSKASQTVALDTPARQQAYVVGQAMAASLREKLSGYQGAGMDLDRARIIAGISDGLRDRAILKRAEMDSAWQTFTEGLKKKLIARVKESETLIATLTAGRKPTIDSDGMKFFVTRKGTPVKNDDPVRSLSLTEKMAPSGKVVSQIPRLTLGPDDDMPAVVRDALPLLDPGAEVEVYALARTVYGTRPLPKDVTPYTVLHYQMKGLAAK